ncbi:peptide ABC transporter ATP-binding protein [Skermanella stibiiresistens SB22]|uniref:Peptide ABC transporter ATP-binding protein n=1 Tax=Skermanella stibiiresistens SB22 TaxID=1385369 RepID=W9H459_9PROT|nr:oligopeptide/dipeptide ABC transporter ATP-binding protein [Skermanella stibiiresistens]EWY41000.1 peptide ABC transporter ATP-binding protein [Skermanella stibiiresistens SB22]
MSECLIRGEGMSRSFHGGGFFRRGRSIQAVSDVSISLSRGEAVGLVGESGSGKSTIGRLMLGLMPLSGGRILFDGDDLAVLDEKRRGALRRRMQMVFQDPYSSLDPRRTVGSQVEDGLSIHGIVPRGERGARVAELLAQVGLEPHHAARTPHQFSGGQRQRVAIARALATNPDFLVADEPVSALDVSVQAQVMALLADLRSRLGLAMLFISHDLPVVRHLCDRVVVLYLGRVMEEGPVSEVLRAPHHPYTRALLSAAPSLHAESRRERVVLRGEPPSPANPPSGCVFRTRCPHAIEACAAQPPPLEPREAPGHRVACIRHDIG